MNQVEAFALQQVFERIIPSARGLFEAIQCLVELVHSYVSNVSIIYEAFMLLYYLFWMFTGFTIHFYIIFGTNLLTGGPVSVSVFLPISVFRGKGISNGIQTERNLREDLSWNKRNPGDLEWKSKTQRGGHEVGGRAQGGRRAPPSWAPRSSTNVLLSSIYTLIP